MVTGLFFNWNYGFTILHNISITNKMRNWVCWPLFTMLLWFYICFTFYSIFIAIFVYWCVCFSDQDHIFGSIESNTNIIRSIWLANFSKVYIVYFILEFEHQYFIESLICVSYSFTMLFDIQVIKIKNINA